MGQTYLEQLQKGKGNRQVICFPYLGGHSQSFQPLVPCLPDVEIWAFTPPGHGLNTEAPLSHMQQLVELYTGELLHVIQPGAVLLGHSLGGLAAYFVAQRLQEKLPDTARTLRLVLSACSTPAECGITRYDHMSDDDLLKHLFSYDGLPKELIHEKELLHYFMPVIRADFRVLTSAATLEHHPVSIPVLYLWGERDHAVSLRSALKWGQYLDTPMKLQTIREGTHMFIMHQPSTVAYHLTSFMTPELEGMNLVE
ncbi:external thioesterase TEII [Paenibacillus sp. JGP012]|uniref:thioesterase II family protein n=1 Tax=Paenibacillus sp. JGP012 TaxID=2735914 RepID=UPI00160F5E75|nr:alpha/beta fold hydrolase [Paenibacillus sp. JGP012]MBB6020433.1 external thioesterase TEII [Paenibacillus sp. JGP012]